MVVFILSVSIALGISFLCSLAEATLLSLTPSQIADINKRHPRLGRIWIRFKEKIDRPIAIILILNTTAHTIGASYAGASFDDIFGEEWMWLFSLVFTFLMLQFTELLPKSLGVRHNKTLALIIGRPLDVAATTLRPVLGFLHFLNRPFHRTTEAGSRTGNTVDEIAALASMARLARQINPQQEKIITGAARLSVLKAKDIMIDKDFVATIDRSTPLSEALVVAHIDAHTRYPVVSDGSFVGYVNFKEIVTALRTNPNDPSIGGILHPLAQVTTEAIASDILRRFVDQHLHIAQVVDGQGNPVGIITMEDIVEELMGDLEDEFDRLPRHSHQLSHGSWLVGGGVPIAELAERCHVLITGGSGSFADWMAEQLGGVAKPGAVVQYEEAQITVRRVRRGRVFEATVVIP